MAIRSIRILMQVDFPSQTIRVWDGSGPYLDGDANVWRGSGALPNLDGIESALNAEAITFAFVVSGVPAWLADLAYQEHEAGDVIGSRVRILIQPCDEHDQPVGDPEVRVTATVDNLPFDDTVANDEWTSTITLECTNRFSLRNIVSGSVYSDVDQRAISARINPEAPQDDFCRRVPENADKTLSWPGW